MGGNTELHVALLHATSEEQFLQELEDNLDATTTLINSTNGSGDTPLMFAVVKQYPRVVKRMLELGADPLSRKTDTGASVLELASSGNHFGILTSIIVEIKKMSSSSSSSLLEDQVLSPNKRGYTALHHAAKRGNYSACKLLIQLGADGSVRNKDGSTPLSLAIECTNSIDSMTEERRKEVLDCCELLCRNTGADFNSIISKSPSSSSSSSTGMKSKNKNKNKKKSLTPVLKQKTSTPLIPKDGDEHESNTLAPVVPTTSSPLPADLPHSSEAADPSSPLLSSSTSGSSLSSSTLSLPPSSSSYSSSSSSSSTFLPPTATPSLSTPPGLNKTSQDRPTTTSSHLHFRPQTQSQSLRKAMKKAKSDATPATTQSPSKLRQPQIKPKIHTPQPSAPVSISQSSALSTVNAWKTNFRQTLDANQQKKQGSITCSSKAQPTHPTSSTMPIASSSFSTPPSSSLNFLSEEIRRLSLEQDEDQRSLATPEVEQELDDKSRISRMQELTMRLHSLSETLVLQPENVLGEGVDCLSMSQLTALEEIHHQLLARIAECRVQLSRREERVKQQEKTLLTLEMLRRKLSQ